MRSIIKISVLFILVFPVFAKAQETFKTHREAERFFNKNLRYPQDALDNCKTGYVLLKFEVDSAGNVSGIEKMFGEYVVLVDEVSRVLKKTNGKWGEIFKKPGTAFLPCYFMYQEGAECNNARPAAVWKDDDATLSVLTEKPVVMQNGVMLKPLVVVGYATVRKMQTKN